MNDKITADLRPGDRIAIGRGIVRTVDRVTDSGRVAMRNRPILHVYYREGRTAEWSGGNSGVADSLWSVLAPDEDG